MEKYEPDTNDEARIGKLGKAAVGAMTLGAGTIGGGMTLDMLVPQPPSVNMPLAIAGGGMFIGGQILLFADRRKQRRQEADGES
jgi:hypothetical protein